MIRYGIIGEHLDHTISPFIYNSLFKRFGIDAIYEKIEIPKDDFANVKDLIKDLQGFNVTVPYKEMIIPYLKSLSEDAKEMGAVNVVSNLNGSNTDWRGFKESLNGVDLKGDTALVIGSGGASRAVCFALKKMQMKIHLKSRNSQKAMDFKKIFDVYLEDPDPESVSIIINATPLGMYPNIDGMPEIDLSKFSKHCVVYDLVYNPPMTRFLKEATELGLRTINGYAMLINQAVLNLKIWSMEDLADYLLRDGIHSLPDGF
ncbi:shikimate dehydrogenase [Athalassotoga saccharophila]|uniref:shikimate dehydrogenase n=1 Tax=Athalassotoga saccharophila TaxID=1441386 RepID=UPI001379F257|nr:shikimate dehydrogenase [Athalassotoga saccharophila]BBJ28731.1 shikimate dehydrogenase (NADP(+)) [Athalassotoga saccharophila]